MMLKKILFTGFLIASTLKLSGQEVNSDFQKAKKLVGAISKGLIYTNRFRENKTSELFSIKLLLSSANKVDSVFVSDNAPQDMVPKLKMAETFKQIDWKTLLGHEIINGDIVIIPIAIYPEDVLNSLPNYNQQQIDKLFVFNGVESYYRCYLLKLVNLREYSPKR